MFFNRGCSSLQAHANMMYDIVCFIFRKYLQLALFQHPFSPSCHTPTMFVPCSYQVRIIRMLFPQFSARYRYEQNTDKMRTKCE